MARGTKWELSQVAERLSKDFPAFSFTTITRVLTECAEELPPHDDILRVEKAARAQLRHERA